jgi:glutamate dehydrogenase
MAESGGPPGTPEELRGAIEREAARFQETYEWLEANMSERFWNEVPKEFVMLIVHNLMSFHLQDYFSRIRVKESAIVLSLDSPDADIKVLSRFRRWGIKHLRHYTSRQPLPNGADGQRLRVTVMYFTEVVETAPAPLSIDEVHTLKEKLRERNPEATDEAFDQLMAGINTRFLRALSLDRLVLALDMYLRAKTRDHCQYEVRYNDDWRETGIPSMQIILAWRNTPKFDFLYRLAKLIFRHKLLMTRVNATYIDPYGRDNVLMLAIGLDGQNDKPAWEAADVPDFLRELVTLKYFGGFPDITHTFVDSGLTTGNLGNYLKSVVYFIHQVLVHVDRHLYTLDSVTEAVCRHPELTVKICEAFDAKFNPEAHDIDRSNAICEELLALIELLDTGHAVNDTRRRNVLRTGVHFVQFCLKTNHYRKNKTGFSFRMDPAYLDKAPFKRHEIFPELPFAIFFIKGMHFIGFHIRFRDLARGGLRTVFPAGQEEMLVELNNVFGEAYNLAYTQQKKNKDIPEGGAKAVIFLKPYESLEIESEILAHELRGGGLDAQEVDAKVKTYYREQKEEYLYQTQRTFVSCLLTLVNCHDDGTLKAKHVVNYYRKPEYLYLGPDERMQASMIQWIAQFSKTYGYKPGVAFISSKPRIGINHKQYGVTSLGVNVYMQEALKELGIDPANDPFTVKISGGPDGDVAGNQIVNLHRYARDTAKLVALVDVSGTIYDPEGLDLDEMVKLFHAERPISYYPPELLHDGGWLLDRRTKRDEGAYRQTTLCWRKKGDELVEDWISSSEMARLFHLNVHQTPADIFIPAGGRPQTLHAGNVREYLDASEEPTSRAIVEGANLYLTSDARIFLQDKGVLIIKDSSANKCGVICSSFEVLCGLVLTEEEMLANKDQIVEEILDVLRERAYLEARLLLDTHAKTGATLTELSDKVSARINQYTDELLSYLEHEPWPNDPEHPFVRSYLQYGLPLLRKHFAQRLLDNVPDIHKKAILACHIASLLVYTRGLDWRPSIVDILPVIWEDHVFRGDNDD